MEPFDDDVEDIEDATGFREYKRIAKDTVAIEKTVFKCTSMPKIIQLKIDP